MDAIATVSAQASQAVAGVRVEAVSLMTIAIAEHHRIIGELKEAHRVELNDTSTKQGAEAFTRQQQALKMAKDEMDRIIETGRQEYAVLEETF